MAPIPAPVVKFGHIDDVQELSRNKSSLQQVPERFVRDTTERPNLEETAISYEIPVIDFSKLVKGRNKDDDNDFCNEIIKLRTCCEEWGFFQVMNHGVDLEKIEKVGMEFFMMPLEEKQKYPMLPGTIQGYGQAFVFSEHQKLDWCNMFALALLPHSARNPNLWPTKPSDFSETLEMYLIAIRKLCKNLLKYIAITLDLKDDVFEEMFGDAVQAVRMNYYPACPRPDLVMGLSPHSDGSGLTVLQQGKGNPVGLHILKDNTWIPVQPIPNCLVINIGDSLEVLVVIGLKVGGGGGGVEFEFELEMYFLGRLLCKRTCENPDNKIGFFKFSVLTNGRYKSVEHRAVTNKEKDRLSIVTFYAPSYENEVGPIPEMVDENCPSNYRRYNHGEYSKHYVTNKLQGKKSLEFAKIN
ncbi:hypothetical protein OROHE_017853 [Orobanche hederae]